MKNLLVPFCFKTLARLPLNGARGVGRFLGGVLFRLKGRDYRMTRRNIANCLGIIDEQQLDQLTKASLKETFCTAAEAGAVWKNCWDWLQCHIKSVEGEDLMRAELAKGQGLLVLAPHLGNWEVVAPYLASVAPLTAMYQPAPIAALDKMILAGRCKNNISMAPTNVKGVSMLLKALKQGTIVGILPDQVPEKEAGGEPTLFFGRYAMTMTLIHALIKRTNCRVVATFAKRVDDGFSLITIPANDLIYSADQSESLRGLNLTVEDCVRLAPEQYQWEYNRYRWLPEEFKARNRELEAKQH